MLRETVPNAHDKRERYNTDVREYQFKREAYLGISSILKRRICVSAMHQMRGLFGRNSEASFEFKAEE